MNDFDEEIVKTYQSANMELIGVIKKYQEETVKCGKFQFLAIIVLSLFVIMISVFAYLNNQKWIEVFNSYEYSTEVIEYTQDGEGVNNINQGMQGDVMDGSNIKDN